MSNYPTKYKLLEDLRSPSLKPHPKTGNLTFKPFKKGQVVIGIDHIIENQNPKIKHAPTILVFDEYLIPKSKVENIQVDAKMPESMSNLAEEMGNNSLKDRILSTSSGYSKGFVIGGVAGIATAMYMKKNTLGYVLFAFGFGIAGALVGQFVADKYQKNI